MSANEYAPGAGTGQQAANYKIALIPSVSSRLLSLDQGVPLSRLPE